MAYRKNGRIATSEAWYRRIENSKALREAHEARWKENKALLLGKEGVKGFKKDQLVNLAWSAFQTLVGAIYAQNPRPVIRERTAPLQNTARMLTDVVDKDLKEMSLRTVTRLAIMDVFYAGFGFILEKLQSDTTSAYFRYTKEAEEEQGEPGESPEEENSEVSVPKDQRYSLTRIHPNAIYFDPVGTLPDLRDSNWLGFEFYPTIQELKDDAEFSVNDSLLRQLRILGQAPQIDGTIRGAVQWKNENASVLAGATPETDDFARVTIIELWDRVNREVLYVPKGRKEIIGQKPWPIELRYNGELLFPGSMLYFNENPDELYPIPELSMIAPQLKQYAILFKQMLQDSVERMRKYVVRGGLLQKGSEAHLLQGKSNSLVMVDDTKIASGDKVSLQDIVMPLVDKPIDADIPGVMNTVKGLIHEIVGAGDFASAGFRSTRSATEAAALTDFLRTRMTSRTENMDAFFKRVVTLHALYLQQTLTEQRVIRTTDINGLAVWKDYTKNDIQGEFDFDVIAGSSMPENTETHRQESIAFFQQVLPIVQNAGGNVRPFVDWIAPMYKIPAHIIDQTFAGHKQALQQLTLMLAAAHQGAKIPGAQLIEAISLAVNTGLSPADIQNVMNQATAAGKSAQPGGLPGTNPSNQTL